MKKTGAVVLLFMILATLFVPFFDVPVAYADACTVDTATFSPHGPQDLENDDWYSDSNQPVVMITVHTLGCAGKEIEMSISQSNDLSDDDDIVEFNNLKFRVNSSNLVTIYLKAGETECTFQTSDPDCNYYLTFFTSDGGLTTAMDTSTIPTGILQYDYDTSSNKNWEIINVGEGNDIYKTLFDAGSSIKFLESKFIDGKEQAKFSITIDTGKTVPDDVKSIYNLVANDGTALNAFAIYIQEGGTSKGAIEVITDQMSAKPAKNTFDYTLTKGGAGFITPNKQYVASIIYQSDDDGEGGGDSPYSLPGGTPTKDYYIIGAPIAFKTSDGVAGGAGGVSMIVSDVPLPIPDGTAGQTSGKLPRCWIDLTSGWDMAGCFSQIVYYVLFVPTSFFFGLTGQMLDFAIDYTTDSDSYGGTNGSFVNEGWKVTRDISNLAFIFILLYTAIGTILNLHEVNWKKTVPKIILIALIINFSLFASRAVIDAGNILARVFYSSIGVKNSETDGSPLPDVAASKKKSVSVAIVSKFNPQTLFSDALHPPNGQGPGGNTGTTDIPSPPTAGWFTIVTLMMTILNLVGIYVFFVVGFLFLARTVGLWILMIFAPFAFISYTIPKGDHGGGGHGSGKMDFLSWSGWWGSLVKQTFVVPIFLFFMYLILKFINTGFLDAKILDDAPDFGTKMLQVGLPLLIVAILLLKSKDIATEYSGVVGEYAIKGAMLAGGLAGGAVLGGAALAGRATAGRLASAVSKSEGLADVASGAKKLSWYQGGKLTQFAAKGVFGAAKTGATASFDARNTTAGKLAAEKSGFNLDKSPILNFAGLSTEHTKGGIEGMRARERVKKAEEGEKYGYNKKKIEALDEAGKSNEKNLKEADEQYKDEQEVYNTNEKKRRLVESKLKKPGLTPAETTALQTELDGINGEQEASQLRLADLNKNRLHYSHEAHAINSRKEDVMKERKDAVASKEEKKAGMTQPTAQTQILAPADMTMPGGKRVRKGDVIIEQGEKVSNSKLKAIMREMKHANVGETTRKNIEKQFDQFEVKGDINFQVRDKVTGNLVSRPTIPSGTKLSPGERDAIIKEMTDGGVPTPQIDNIKKQFKYIDDASAQAEQAATTIAKRTAQGAAIGLAAAGIGAAPAAVAGLGFGVAEAIRDYFKYTKNTAKSFATAIRDGASPEDLKYAIKEAAVSHAKPAGGGKKDDHGAHAGH